MGYNAYFCTSMKKRLYIFHLWVATFAILLSTIVMHHHHYDHVCMVMEQCAEDGNLNNEHTEHQFVVNAKVVTDICKHISDAGTMLQALLPDITWLPLDSRLVAVDWQETTEPLGEGFLSAHYLRGPPAVSLL